jgi:uncharacterized RDD family membrane protein YckC
MGEFTIDENSAVADPFGWTGSPPAQTPPAAAGAGEAVLAPDAAVRSRLAAIVIDNIVIGIPIGVLAAALGASVRSPDILLVIAGAEFLYFFAFELLRGQTIGKRQYHLRVVSLDGSPPTMRQIAIRNVLRFIDVLPICYASGQISMIRTGAARRQRLGDVVAGTTVVLEGEGRRLRTPRWLLPLTTLIALGLSVLVVVGIADPGSSGTAGAPQTVSFPGLQAFYHDAGAPPQPGSWRATGATIWSIGYANDYTGRSVAEVWTITRNCTGGPCSFTLTRGSAASGQPVSSPLTLSANGWQATFALGSYACHAGDGSASEWQQQSVMLLSFSDGGRRALAHEQNISRSDTCGAAGDGVDWSAAIDGS